MAKPKLGSGARFKAGTSKLMSKGYSKSSASKIMAAAGQKKYGKAKMAKMAAKGRRSAC